MQPREKLKLFLDAKGLSNSQFAEIVTKPRQYITNILNGTKNFGLDFVIILGYKFPDLDLNWLLRDDTGNIEYSVVETSISTVPDPKNKYDNRSRRYLPFSMATYLAYLRMLSLTSTLRR